MSIKLIMLIIIFLFLIYERFINQDKKISKSSSSMGIVGVLILIFINFPTIKGRIDKITRENKHDKMDPVILIADSVMLLDEQFYISSPESLLVKEMEESKFLLTPLNKNPSFLILIDSYKRNNHRLDSSHVEFIKKIEFDSITDITEFLKQENLHGIQFTMHNGLKTQTIKSYAKSNNDIVVFARGYVKTDSLKGFNDSLVMQIVKDLKFE